MFKYMPKKYKKSLSDTFRSALKLNTTLTNIVDIIFSVEG
jgi:hypothetical protein